MFLYLGGCWTPPYLYTPLYICTPPYVCMPPYIHTPPGVYTPPGAPMLLCSCMVLAHCMLWGGCFLYWDTPPLFGGASPLITPPHSIVGSLCIVILRDISSYVGLSPSIEGFGGVPPITGGGLGWHIKLFTYSFCYTFCSALCLTSQPQLRLLLLQLQWYLLACHQCHQYQWLLL